MAKNQIKVKNYSYIYKGNQEPTIEDISFKLRKGQILTILGKSKAGKTTLCQSINGIIPHYHEGKTRGEVKIEGKSIKNLSLNELSKKIGYLQQEPRNQIIGRTVQEDVSFGPINQGMKRNEILQRLKEALDLTNLEGLEERNVNNLSGGETKKLALANLLASGSEIIIMDEPTRALDPRETKNLFKIIKKLKKENKTILITTKKISVAEHFDRIITLKNGKITKKINLKNQKLSLNKLIGMGLRINQKHDFLLELKRINKEKRDIKKLNPLKKDKKIIKELKNKITGIKNDNIKKTNEVNHRNKIIKAKNISFSYDGNEILKNLNLTLNEKEYFGLVGANGSGKTTLAKIIAGLNNPVKGKIEYKNKNLKNIDQKTISQKIGYVFQNPADQIFNKSVKKEIEFSLRLQDLTQEEKEKRINKILNKFNLKNKKEHFPFSLNFSERKKLVLAAITAMNPEVIILDEPMAGLDELQKENLKMILSDLNQKGTTVLHISHDLDYLIKKSDRIGVLHNKSLKLKEDVRDLFKNNPKKYNLSTPFTPKLSKELENQKITLKPRKLAKKLVFGG